MSLFLGFLQSLHLQQCCSVQRVPELMAQLAASIVQTELLEVVQKALFEVG